MFNVHDGDLTSCGGSFGSLCLFKENILHKFHLFLILKTMNIHELKYDMQSQKTLLKVSIIEISFNLSTALLLNSSK